MCRVPPVLRNVSALLFVWRSVGVRIRGAMLEVTNVPCVCVSVFVWWACVCCVRADSWPDSLYLLCVKERVILVCPSAAQRGVFECFFVRHDCTRIARRLVCYKHRHLIL